MNMNAADIVRDYEQAADKRAQVQILADLNLCSKNAILDVLVEGGCKVDNRWYSKCVRQKRSQQDKGPEPKKPKREQRGHKYFTLSQKDQETLESFLVAYLPEYLKGDCDLLDAHALIGIYKRLTEAHK